MQLIANFTYGSRWKYYQRVSLKSVQVGALDVRSPEIMVTDAKSLFDHLQKNGFDPQGQPHHDRSAGDQGPGGELGVTKDVGYSHLDKGDAHDRGVPVVAGRWQIYDAPDNKRE